MYTIEVYSTDKKLNPIIRTEVNHLDYADSRDCYRYYADLYKNDPTVVVDVVDEEWASVVMSTDPEF